jgi:hypothetical protein
MPEEILMSHHVEQSWIERYWQVFLIAFAITYVLFWALFKPGV